MKRDTRIRLGAGDFVAASAPNPFARVRYLLAVERCVPEALEALAALADDGVELQAWAQRWGFTDDWALRHARNHFHFWRDEPDMAGRWSLFPLTMFWAPTFPAAPSWDPTTETRSEYLARHARYLATVETAAGIQPTPEKADGRHFEWTALYHVGGLQLGQIAELYQEKFPDEYDGLTPGAVSEAIKGVAQLVGLTRRRKQGRPLKTSVLRLIR